MCVSGSSDYVGFNLDVRANGNATDLPGDNANIWVKPIEQVKIVVGKIDQNVLMGNCAYGLWNWDRLGVVGDNDSEKWTFWDYLDAGSGDWYAGRGASIIATPVEGLTIGAGIPLDLNGSHADVAVTKDNGDADDPYKQGSLQDSLLNSAFVGGYNIADIGTVKAAVRLHNGPARGNTLVDGDGTEYKSSYPRNKDGKDVKTWAEIAAAFDLTSVENLFVSVGARIRTLNTQFHEVNAYAKYNVNDAFTVHAIVGTKINACDAKKTAEDGSYKTGFGFLGGVGVDYALDGGIGLFADVRYANNIYASGTSADNSDNLVLGAGVTKGFSNGLVGVAFEGSTNSKGRYDYKDGKQFAWEIPVRFEYWF